MKKLLTLFAALSVIPLVAFAHHGHNNQFDSEKEIEVSGIVTELKFVNPHSYVMFDVTNASGDVEAWRCEMRAANILKRSGWTEEMFQPGTPITVNGIASRHEATGCYAETLALGDQEAIGRYDQLAENSDVVDEVRAERTAWGVPNLAGNWAADQQLPDTSNAPSYQGGPPGAAAGGMGAPPEGGGGRGGPGAGQAGSTMSEAGTAAMARLQVETDGDGTHTLDCSPRDFFSDWTFDQHTNLIVQEEDKITLKYGFMDTERVIHLDINEHPKVIEPSFTGHSIGWWQDDVLVVHTIGFPEKLMVQGPRVAGATSERYHVTERFSVDHEAGALTRSYVARDSLYWVEGHEETGAQVISLADYPWEPYGCEDLTVQ